MTAGLKGVGYSTSAAEAKVRLGMSKLDVIKIELKRLSRWEHAEDLTKPDMHIYPAKSLRLLLSAAACPPSRGTPTEAQVCWSGAWVH